MKRDKTNKHPSDPDLSGEFFSRAKIPWEKSREEVWMDLTDQLQEEHPPRVIVRRMLPGNRWIAMAASITLLLAVASFLRFYSRTLETLPAEHASYELPDGSLADLNAVSTLSYHPFWWWISREVKLEGEAFFRVEEGSTFRANSENAYTEVRGTSFNVYARKTDYRVVCHSGSVQVSSKLSDETVVLNPEMQASIDASGAIQVATLDQMESTPGWKTRMLMFSSVPLRLVFDEIERQYGIRIRTPFPLNHRYSGNFALDASVENVLTLLCLPFDLRYEQTSGNTYTITPIRTD
jgi:ferric-dicitrate binding protein FerR (iron transport regulator)